MRTGWRSRRQTLMVKPRRPRTSSATTSKEPRVWLYPPQTQEIRAYVSSGATDERFSFKNGKDGATWDKKYQLLGPDGVDCDTMNQGDGVSSSSIRTGFTSIHMLKAGEGEDVWLPEDRSVITICDYSFQFNFNLARRVGIDWQQFFPTSLLSTREPVAINKWGIVAVHGHATF